MSVEINKPASTKYWMVLRPDGSFDVGTTEPDQVTTSGAARFEQGDSLQEAAGKFSVEESTKAKQAIGKYEEAQVSNKSLLDALQNDIAI